MSNPFDQFDAPTAGGNPFDQFDAPKAKQNKGIAGDTITDLKRGIEQITGIVTGLADIPIASVTGDTYADKAANVLGDITGFQPSKWAKDAEAEYSPKRRASSMAVDKAWQDNESPFSDAMDGDFSGIGNIAKAYAQNPLHTLGAVVESLPSMAAGGLAGRAAVAASKIAPRIGGAIGEGAVMAGQQMNQLTEAGADPRMSAAVSLPTGVLGAGIGAMGGKLAQTMGVVDPETVLAGGAVRGVAAEAGDQSIKGMVKEGAKRVAGGAMSEGFFEELPQSVLEQTLSNLAQGKPWDEGVSRAAVEGTLAGSLMGGAFNVLPPSVQAPGQQPPDNQNQNPLLALPAPTYTGTPGDQIIAADTERQAAIDKAQAEADALYAARDAYELEQRRGFPGGVPTITNDPAPIQQRIDALLGINQARLTGIARSNYEKALEAAFNERIGFAVGKDSMEIPVTMGDYLASKVAAGDIDRNSELGQRIALRQMAGQNATNRLQQLADEEAMQQPDIAPIPVAGPISAAANVAVQSGVSALAQAQQVAEQMANQEKPAEQQQESTNPLTAALQQGGISAAVPEQVATQAPQTNDAQAASFDVSKRTDKQLEYLTQHGQPGWKEAAVAELQKRGVQVSAPQQAKTDTLAPDSKANQNNEATADKIFAGKKAAYAEMAETGAPADVVAASVMRWQGHTNTRNEPMNLWRSKNGALGLTPANQKSPFVDGVLVTTMYPEANTEANSATVPAQNADDSAKQEAANNNTTNGDGVTSQPPKQQAPAPTEEQKKPKKPLSVGVMPGAAEPITVNDGVVYIGKYPAQNFDTGEDVTVPAGATDKQVVTALKDAGAIAGKMRVFGMEKEEVKDAIGWTSMTTVEREGLLHRAGYGGANMRLNLAGTRIARTAWDAMSPAVQDKLTAAYENQFKPADQNQIKNENPSAATVSEEKKAPGQDPIKNIDAAANEAATSAKNDTPQPTEAQQEAGNYKKGHITVQGLNITIENPEGSKRSGTDEDGKAWEATMAAHYGYIKRTEGNDGDHVDVYVGNDPDSDIAFIVDQSNADGSFDEHKVLLGFPNALSATRAYAKSYEPGWMASRVIAAEKLTVSELKDWLKNGDMSKPYSSKKADQPSAETVTVPEKSEASTVSQQKTDAAPEAKQDKAPTITPQHVENGQAEPATAAVVAQSLKKGAANSPLDLRQERDLLLKKIDAAIAEAPTAAEKGAWDNVNQKIDLKNNMHVEDTIGYRGFEVPGDGKFKVLNLKEALQRFRDRVEANPGFKKPVNTTGLQKVAPWQRTTSGGSESTIMDLLESGEYSAAVEYAKQIGKPLVFGQYQDGSAITVYTDAKPFEREGYDDFNMVSVRNPQGANKVAWAVVDLNSGLTISSMHPTRLKAIAETNKALEKTTPAQLATAVRSVKANAAGLVGTQDELEQRWLDNVEKREAEAQAKNEAENSRKAKDPGSYRTATPYKQAEEVKPAAQSNALDATDYKGFKRVDSAEYGKFELRDGNMVVKVEANGGGKYQASFGSAKSSPHLIGEQGAVDWAASYRADSRKNETDEQRYERIKATPVMQRDDKDVKWANEYKGRQQKAEAEAEAKKADEQKAAIKADSINGFLDGKAPMQAGAIRNALNKQWRFDGVVMTARERIESLWRDGKLALKTYEENKIKPMSRRDFNRASQREQDAHENKMREAGTKTVYVVSESELGKIAYDYAQHLLAKTADANPTVNAEKQPKTADKSEKYAGPADVSTKAGQVELANRASTIAVLKAMNEQLRQIAADEAWADRNIEESNDLDGLRDRISQALVDAQRGKQAANPLRNELEALSGKELKAVFDKMGLAGKLMGYEERISALLLEDSAEVRKSIASVVDEESNNPSDANPTVDAEKPAEKNSFTLDRLNRETNQMEPVTFERGEYVRYTLSGKDVFGEISGISHARREFAVDGLWYPFGFAYKADRPAEPAPATVADHQSFLERLNGGDVKLDEFKARFASLKQSKDALFAELEKKTKAQLLDLMGGYAASRYKNEKKERIVDVAYRTMLDDFVLGDSISYGFGSKYEDVIGNYVSGYVQTDLDAYAEKVKARRAEREQRREETAKAIADPQTLEDYRRLMQAKVDGGKTVDQARIELTPAQRVAFDGLLAEESRSRRGQRAEAVKTEIRVAAKTTSGDIIETKHTKTGQDLFVVKAAERVERDVYNQWNAAAKKLGGWYSSFRGNGAVPGFQFKTRDDAAAFLQYLGGDATAAQEAMQEKRDAFADDRSQSAVERLTEMAERLDERAEESLGRERKANTARRARFAAAAEAAASSDKALAKTMRNIAKAIADGTAKFLDRVRQKAQVELLRSTVKSAQYTELQKKYPSYANQEKHRGEKPTAETADHARWPTFTADRADLARLGRDLLQIDGAKLLGQRILKVADDVTKEYQKFAKENLHKVSVFSAKREGSEQSQPAIFSTADNAEAAIARSGYKGKATTISFKRGEHLVIMGPEMAREAGLWQGDPDRRITLTPEAGEEIVAKVKALGKGKVAMPYVFENVAAERARWKGLGIETAAEQRSALREFIALQEAPAAPDRVKQLERAMVGRANDGLDFFPTPAETAQAMIEAADIQEGMRVLEPSAGMGHIAEQIRDVTGVDPDVIEFSGNRRELLEAKGFNVVGQDFMETVGQYDRIVMNPPFSNRRDAEHVQHAYSLLKPGGRLVAIMGEGVFYGQDRKAQAFREWLEEVGGTSEKLEEGTFLDPSLPVNTGVNARMVVVDKPEGDAATTDETETDRGTALYNIADNPFVPDGYDARAFSDAVARIAETGHAPRSDLTIGDTPEVFKALGASAKTMVMPGSVVAKATNPMLRGHDVRLEDLKNLPALLADPVMVFDSQTEAGALVAMVEAKDASGNPVIVAIHVGAKGSGFHSVNKIASVYGKEGIAEIQRWIDSSLRYYNKQKAPQWLRAVGLQLPEANTIKRLNRSVVTDSDIVKTNAAGNDKLSPADTAIYGMAAEGKSAADILKFIASASRNPFNRQVAKLLLKTGIAPKAMAGTDQGWKFNAGNDKKYAAAYNEKTDTISLFRPAAAERNFLHEAIHAATIRALGRKGMAAGQMKALFAHVQKTGKLKGMYGMSDVDEFIAEAFSNPKFQDALKKVAAPKASGALSSAWNWFVRIVKGILGLPANQESALSQALEIGLGVMRENMALQSGDGVIRFNHALRSNPEGNRPLNAIRLAKLRRIAAGLERPKDAVFLRVTEDGKAITTGPKGVRIPETFIRFAESNGLDFEVRRNGEGRKSDGHAIGKHITSKTEPMPPEYRESGALYFGEGNEFFDRTGKTRYNAAPGKINQTDTEAFKRWFGDSKVVDSDGKPLRVFHGTASDITAFDIGRSGESTGNTGFYGAGAYFSEDADYASGFSFWARRSDDQAPNVVPVYLSLKNPAYINITPRSQSASEKSRVTAEKIISTMIARGTDQAVVDKLQGFVSENKFEPFMGTLYNALGGGTGTTALLKEAGFDGVTIYGGISGKEKLAEAVAFDPTQIKSAIGNYGDFDGTNPDIRYNVADEGWSVSEPSKMDDVIYALQDKHIDTKRVIQAIAGAGRRVRDNFNAYLQEELFHGRAAKGVKDFLDFELRPLLKEMQAQGVDMGDFEEYLWNRHAEERNKQIAKINTDMPDGGSGIATAEARAYLAGLSAEQKAKYEALAKRVDAMNRGSQKVLVESGLESAETIAAWNGAYQSYVPLQREDVDSGHMGTGKGFSIRGSASKRAMGSGKKVVDIIANIAMQRERNIVRAEKNRVSNALMGLAMENPNPEFWKVDQAPKERVVNNVAIYNVLDAEGNKVADFTNMAEADRMARSLGGEVEQTWGDRVQERIEPGFKNRDNVVLTRVNGKDHYIIFNERDERAMRMAQSLKNLDVDNMGRVLSVVGKATRYLASVNTQYNPVFGVINLIRDAQGAMVNLTSTPLAGDQKKVLGYTVDALRGIYSDIRAHRRGEKPSSNWANLFEEFQKEGGQTGYRDQYANAEARAEAIQSEIEQFKEGKAKQLTRGIFGWLSDYNETMENAVRLAAYKAGKERGLSNQQAASVAKNITVNFNRKGQMATQVGALYAFFNASVQGTARIAETLFEQHGGDMKNVRLSRKGRQIVTGGILLGSMQALLLAAAGYGDDEPPEFIRERNLVLPIGDGKYLTLAMPLGFHVIPGTGRIATEFVMSGFKDPLKRMAQFGSMFAEAFNPVGNSGFSLQTITPSVVDPFAALAENKDFTGKEIYRENFNSLNPQPGHARAKDTATIWSKVISEGINTLTGGTEFKPGLVSPSPDAIDYLIGQATGGVGRELSKAFQTAESSVTGEELPIYKVPLVGRFIGDTKGQAGESAKFYEAIKQINMHEAEYKGLIKAGRRDEAAEYLAENPQVKLMLAGNSAETQVRKLRTAKRELLESGADPAQVAAIEEKITGAMRAFNERVGNFERLSEGKVGQMQ